MDIIFILIGLYVIFWQSCLIIASIWGAPTVFANNRAILDALDLAAPKKNDLVIDLGCGDARSLIIAAEHFGAHGIGVERSPYCWIKANINVLLAHQSNKVKILFGDFKVAEKYLQKSDVIYLYLLNKVLEAQENWLFDHISSKTRIVSLCFQFRIHKPQTIISTVNLGRKTNIYLYKK